MGKEKIEWNNLSTEVLKLIASEKTTKGIATSNALKAQEILASRSNSFYDDLGRYDHLTACSNKSLVDIENRVSEEAY